MSPIKPENRGRYPKNWKQIRDAIVKRARDLCEFCGVRNYEPHPKTRSRVVLTVAHMGIPAQLPVYFHVARSTHADQIIKIVGLVMAPDPKLPEWNSMMHHRALTEFNTGAIASDTGAAVPFERGPTSRPPRWAITLGSATIPVQAISLSEWCQLGKPIQPASISAKTASRLDIKSADVISRTASLTYGMPESSLRAAHLFVATGRRASDFVIGRLLRGQLENGSTNRAVPFDSAFSGSSHSGTLHHMDEYPENCSAENLRALCQRCHNAYDADHRAENRRRTMEAKKAQMDFFGGSK